jgi:hypothetical protein
MAPALTGHNTSKGGSSGHVLDQLRVCEAADPAPPRDAVYEQR